MTCGIWWKGAVFVELWLMCLYMQVLDYGSAIISPGVIDVHVHMNEPGRVEWEGEPLALGGSAHYCSCHSEGCPVQRMSTFQSSLRYCGMLDRGDEARQTTCC